MLIYLLPLFLSLSSCSQNPSPSLHTLEVYGRSHPTTLSPREFIYRMQVPDGWNVHFPPPTVSLVDTREPLFTLVKNDIIVTFHNFPSYDSSPRMPVIAQAARWKNQFTELDESHLHITPFAVAGFVGLQFDGTGIQKETPTRVLAWALQLTPELLSKLPNDAVQQKADWTLKAVGSPDNLSFLESELLIIARSVELIQEIPSR